MKGNKYDNLYGDDRDWIEEALRDHDVPEGVINEIGAHFFVLQTKIDKIEAEKANKRDIFAEIGRESSKDQKLDSFFSQTVNDIVVEDVMTHLTPKKVKREPYFQSLKTGPWVGTSLDDIRKLWPIGMAVSYFNRARTIETLYVRTDAFTLSVDQRDNYSPNSIFMGSISLKSLVNVLHTYDRRKLIKKLLKNAQRMRDKATENI